MRSYDYGQGLGGTGGRLDFMKETGAIRFEFYNGDTISLHMLLPPTIRQNQLIANLVKILGKAGEVVINASGFKDSIDFFSWL